RRCMMRHHSLNPGRRSIQKRYSASRTTSRRYRVLGRVQGVGFRHFVFGRASALGLTGWVRNRADGTVEVLAHGDDSQQAALREALGEGPPGARVTSLHDEDATASDAASLEGFRVLPTAR